MADDGGVVLAELSRLLPGSKQLQAIWHVIERLSGVPNLDEKIRESDDDFIVGLAQRLERVEVRAAEATDPLEVRELVLMAIAEAHRTADAEKRAALRNVVVNAVSGDHAADDVHASLVLRTIGALDAVHIHVLRLVACASPVTAGGKFVGYLAAAPRGVEPHEFARHLHGRGGVLTGQRCDVARFGVVENRPVDERRVVEAVHLDSGLVRKVLIDLEVQGLLYRHHESDFSLLFVGLTTFGVHTFLYVCDADSEI